MSETAITDLRERLGEVSDLERVAFLLGWDQETMMPPAGAPSRADQLGTIERLAHERFVTDEVGALLDALAPLAADGDESDDACLVRVSRRDFDKARRVPGDLVAELARVTTLAHHAWIDARKASDFAAFLPHLRRVVELKHRYVACFPDAERPYDALLDDFEPGMRTAEVVDVFAHLRDGLVPLVAAAAGRADAVDDTFLGGPFAEAGQRALNRTVLDRFGFDPDAWRLDDAVHPFATTLGRGDQRITTRYAEDSLDSLFSTMHEYGHGLYEAGVDPALARTPLGSGCSMALHESQSRMWENMVGRSRGFWTWALPEARSALPGSFDERSVEDLVRAVNVVRPSLIRVEADEVTYALHVIIRFELELELFEGDLALEDLPEAWNARYRDYLGIEVPDDRRGVLQDVHWAGGAFGYFPTYALGNVVAGQIWKKVNAEVPDLDAQFARGEFGPLGDWLRDRLHRHGRKFTPAETLARIVGGPIDPEPYLAYLRTKVGAVYGL